MRAQPIRIRRLPQYLSLLGLSVPTHTWSTMVHMATPNLCWMHKLYQLWRLAFTKLKAVLTANKSTTFFTTWSKTAKFQGYRSLRLFKTTPSLANQRMLSQMSSILWFRRYLKNTFLRMQPFRSLIISSTLLFKCSRVDCSRPTHLPKSYYSQVSLISHKLSTLFLISQKSSWIVTV